MLCLEPCPMATMAMTLATPMMIPSMVRKALSLFRWSAFKAIRRRLKRLMIGRFRVVVIYLIIFGLGQRGQDFFGRFSVFIRAVFHHLAIFEHDRTAAKGGYVGLMGDK